MYSRRYFKPASGRLKLVEPMYKMTELFFTIEGTFGLYHPKLKPIKNKKDLEQPAVLIPRHAVFGDYQLLLDSYPCVEKSPFIPNGDTP